MEIFKNKFLLKLIATVCLFLTLFNFGVTNTVYADDEGLGGKLLKPIVHLITALGDGIVNIMHRVAMSQKETLFEIRGYTAWEAFWRGLAVVAAVIIAVVVVVVVCYFTCGIGAYIIGAIAGTTITISASVVIGIAALRYYGGLYCWIYCFVRIFSGEHLFTYLHI